MDKKIDFLGITVDALSMKETVDKIENTIINKKQIHHSVINAGKVVLMQKDENLKQSVLEASLINADGQGVVWAARFLGEEIPERVSGIDLMQKLVAISHEKGYKCFFFGATDNIVKEVVKRYSQLYSKDIIAGYMHGYYNIKDEADIVRDIAQSGANILFVAITSPKKEIFLNKFKKELGNVNFIMGVGGSFDVVSGEINRAPLFMQRYGFEWFYRFLQEPRRMWKRYLIGNFNFLFLILKEKLKRIFY